jgi:hypothetical protein
MVAEYAPALMLPGFAATVNEPGVTPEDEDTPIQAGAGVPADPPSTETLKLTGVAQPETIAIDCEGAAFPPANAEKPSDVGDACNGQVVDLAVTVPEPASVN